MLKLPPPPRFILPPPPIFPSHAFHLQIPLQLTCSSIQQQQQHLIQQDISLQLILISSIIFCSIAIILILLFIWNQSYSIQQRSSRKIPQPRSISHNTNYIPICSNCLYEQISSDTDLRSIDNTVATQSIISNHGMSNHCHLIFPSHPCVYETIT